MEIIGTVVSIKENIATVKVKRASSCGENCANCASVCETTQVMSDAYNIAGAKIGDTVKIESKSTDVLRAVVALYMLPVLVAILSAIVAYGNKLSDIFVILISVISFFASFFVIKCFEKRLTPKSYITKIISKGVK